MQIAPATTTKSHKLILVNELSARQGEYRTMAKYMSIIMEKIIVDMLRVTEAEKDGNLRDTTLIDFSKKPSEAYLIR